MIKQLIQHGLNIFGLELRRATRPEVEAGSFGRPIGNLRSFLEDVRARNLVPGGVLDVGAHRGDWTRLVLSIFPHTRVIMVEPQDEMEPYLKELCTTVQSCQYIKAAVGRSDGELMQTIWDDLAASSFLPKPESADVGSGHQRLTRVTTIDRLLTQNSRFRPDIVKLDIQGFEIEALSGGAALFGKTELFIVETSLFAFMQGQPITREVIQYMADRGYEVYDITEYIRRPFDGALGQVDIAFAKRDGVLRSNNWWRNP